MSERSIPHNDAAEEALIAAVMVDPQRMEEARQIVRPSDFYRPRNEAIWTELERLYREGRLRSYDSVTLADALAAHIAHEDLLELLADYPGWSPEHARIIVRLSVARQVIRAGEEVTRIGYAADLPPDELVDAAAAATTGIDAPVTAADRTAGLRSFDDFVSEVDRTPEPWVIPGMLRRGWRCVVVATEGAGKSWLMRSLVGGLAAGVHALTGDTIEPGVGLVIDLENPRDAIAESLGVIDQAARRSDLYGHGLAMIESRPEGLDIRSRSGRLDLEALVAEVRPNLVCLGPVYKLYRAAANETDELAAGEAMAVLDDLRTRYGFALVLEHHAPKGSMSGRDILPHGTALWLRWPELGVKLLRGDAPGTLDVGRWREDRVRCTWPDRLERARPWPWRGIYYEENY